VSTTSTGRAAEALAADHLVRQGFTLLDRNWRNRWCELDIVARHGGVVHIVEVKYRASTAFGLPAEFVRHDKLARLGRAALAWTQAHAFQGPYQIDVISLCGSLESPQIDHIVDISGLA
jgi:putative endonuclease